MNFEEWALQEMQSDKEDPKEKDGSVDELAFTKHIWEVAQEEYKKEMIKAIDKLSELAPTDRMLGFMLLKEELGMKKKFFLSKGTSKHEEGGQ